MYEVKRKIKGKEYIYSEKSMKYRGKVIKYSKINVLKEDINEYNIEHNLSEKISKLYIKPQYPLTHNEIKKIELMNFSYKKLKLKFHKKDWEDIKKRFVANFVFESNAIEGNSLTLKNFKEIIFENKLISGADLREVYDAKNSYEVFSYIFNSRKEIDINFIIDIHKKLMKNIDNRIGFKKIPNVLFGKRIKLTNPENVEKEMINLINWYNEIRYKIHPLELAFKFHHKFEKIHPFADGNGRVGRIILNYILLKEGYFPIIIRKSNRQKYIKSLEDADNGNYIPLIRFAIEKAKDTYRKFFEVYSKYL
jgi:Fic family protein